MDIFIEGLKQNLPWLLVMVLILIAPKLVSWAKQRRSVAVTFGILAQMLLPDPNVQKTIETVVEIRQEAKKPGQKLGKSTEPNQTENTSD